MKSKHRASLARRGRVDAGMGCPPDRTLGLESVRSSWMRSNAPLVAYETMFRIDQDDRPAHPSAIQAVGGGPPLPKWRSQLLGNSGARIQDPQVQASRGA